MVQPVWITLDPRVVCVCHLLSFRVGTFHDIHVNTITWHQHHLNLRPYHHLCISRNVIWRISLRYFMYAPLEGHCLLSITFAAIAPSSIALPAGGVLKLDWSIGLDGQMAPSHESRMYTVCIYIYMIYMYVYIQCTYIHISMYIYMYLYWLYCRFYDIHLILHSNIFNV